MLPPTTTTLYSPEETPTHRLGVIGQTGVSLGSPFEGLGRVRRPDINREKHTKKENTSVVGM